MTFNEVCEQRLARMEGESIARQVIKGELDEQRYVFDDEEAAH